ncbi:Sulfotransferase family protein [Candidatus Promineifilum breve]|uniref:Sulfotransferase family protein n=2 Tax=Candidatus Promineifilum breve TaxID=1806508 RepID=A0A160T1P9_9CHLR|nr:sulfotransferase [Candidatus Promineifilum breve]CUS03422.2 Sulfotransferase family protein [Candidatus Promineifilum breve]
MVNNHRHIIVPPECGFAVWWYDKYRHWGIDSSRDPQLLDGFLADLAASKKIETWNLDYVALRDAIAANQPASYAELVACIYTFFGHTTGKTFQRWGDKNNFYIQHIATLAAMFPDAAYVHIVRDGRDVACSYRKLAVTPMDSKYAPHLATDIAAIAAEWADNNDQATSAFDAAGRERVCIVRYEDLVTNSETELRRLCAFLAEPYDEQMLEYYLWNRKAHQEPLEFLQWKRKTLEMPTDSEVGKYRSLLTAEEIAVFDRIAGATLARYGY